MHKREVVSYIISCVLIIAVIMLLFLGDAKKYNNRYLIDRVEELEEEKITLQMEVDIEDMQELVTGEDGRSISKEERIKELELLVIAKTLVLDESYELIEGMEFYIDILKEIMNYNNVIYPEFIYAKITQLEYEEE